MSFCSGWTNRDNALESDERQATEKQIAERSDHEALGLEQIADYEMNNAKHSLEHGVSEPNVRVPSVTITETERFDTVYARVPLCGLQLHSGVSDISVTVMTGKSYTVNASVGFAVKAGLDWASLTATYNLISSYTWSENEIYSHTVTTSMPRGFYRMEKFIRGGQKVKVVTSFQGNEILNSTETVIAEYAPNANPLVAYGVVGYDYNDPEKVIWSSDMGAFKTILMG